MRKLFDKIIFRFKGSEFKLDPNIPMSYLLNLSFQRFIMLFRSVFIFCTKKGIVFIAPSAIIKGQSKLQLGSGVTVFPNCYIDAMSKDGIVLGDNVSVGRATIIECTGSIRCLGKGMTVGNNVGLGNHCLYGCAGGISIGDDTIFGAYVSLHAENHNFEDKTIPIRLQGVNHKGIIIGKSCWIGAKVTILDGVQIGDNCIIAAGSVVSKGTYPSDGVYGGIPAKLIRKR